MKTISFTLFVLPFCLLAQLQPDSKNYFAVAYSQGNLDDFYVMALYTTQPAVSTGNKYVYHMPFVSRYNAKNHNDGLDTMTYPLGRNLIIENSGRCLSVNYYNDTNVLLKFNSHKNIPLHFKQHKDSFILKLNAQIFKRLFDGNSDSIAIYDLYRKNKFGSENLLKTNWYTVGKNSGIHSFHNFNELEDTSEQYIAIPYRNPAFRELVNYKPGDWIEYTTQDNHQGPPDYQVLEVLEKNSTTYKVKHIYLETISQYPKMPYVVEKYFVDTVNYPLDSWMFGKKEFIEKNNYSQMPPKCFGVSRKDSFGSNMQYASMLLYDTLNNKFTYTPGEFSIWLFEDWWTGWSIKECIGPVIKNERLRTSALIVDWKINAYILQCGGSFGNRYVNTMNTNTLFEYKLYPNPADEYVTIESCGFQKNDLLILQDLFGKTVRTMIVTTPYFTLDTKNLKPGIYTVQRDKNKASTKLVVLH